MDESFQELEAELKALRPRHPSAELPGRIGHELDADPGTSARARYTSATNLDSWKWLGWRRAGVVTAMALVAVAGVIALKRQLPSAAVTPSTVAAVSGQPQPAVEPAALRDRYQPVAATNVLYDLKDEGPVNVAGDAPARRLRYRYLDTYTWKNPKSNASLKWSVPRDEIRVMPASMN